MKLKFSMILVIVCFIVYCWVIQPLGQAHVTLHHEEGDPQVMNHLSLAGQLAKNANTHTADQFPALYDQYNFFWSPGDKKVSFNEAKHITYPEQIIKETPLRDRVDLNYLNMVRLPNGEELWLGFRWELEGQSTLYYYLMSEDHQLIHQDQISIGERRFNSEILGAALRGDQLYLLHSSNGEYTPAQDLKKIILNLKNYQLEVQDLSSDQLSTYIDELAETSYLAGYREIPLADNFLVRTYPTTNGDSDAETSASGEVQAYQIDPVTDKVKLIFEAQEAQFHLNDGQLYRLEDQFNNNKSMSVPDQLTISQWDQVQQVFKPIQTIDVTPGLAFDYLLKSGKLYLLESGPEPDQIHLTVHSLTSTEVLYQADIDFNQADYAVQMIYLR